MNRLIRYLLHWLYRPILIQYLTKERQCNIEDLKLTIPVSVFHPAFFGSSKAFASFLKTQPLEHKSLLEIGCGSGILSIIAAKKGAEVTAIDINESAVLATRKNAIDNRVTITTLKSDLFEQLKGLKFDIVIINPPFFRGQPSKAGDYAWYAGEQLDFFKRFFKEIYSYVTAQPSVWMILSEKCDIHSISNLAKLEGIQMVEIYRQKRLFENFVIYLLSGSFNT